MLEQSSTGRTYTRDQTSPRLRRAGCVCSRTPRRSCQSVLSKITAGSGNVILHRTSSDTNLSRRVFSLFKENAVHISTKNTSGISCARSYRYPTGRFLSRARFPRHCVPGYDRCVPTGRACNHFATASSYSAVMRFSSERLDEWGISRYFCAIPQMTIGYSQAWLVPPTTGRHPNGLLGQQLLT